MGVSKHDEAHTYTNTSGGGCFGFDLRTSLAFATARGTLIDLMLGFLYMGCFLEVSIGNGQWPHLGLTLRPHVGLCSTWDVSTKYPWTRASGLI